MECHAKPREHAADNLVCLHRERKARQIWRYRAFIASGGIVGRGGSPASVRPFASEGAASALLRSIGEAVFDADAEDPAAVVVAGWRGVRNDMMIPKQSHTSQ